MRCAWTNKRGDAKIKNTTSKYINKIAKRDGVRITRIKIQTKRIFLHVEIIKRWKEKGAGHIARRQYNRWSKNNLQWYPRDAKRPLRQPRVRWINEIKEVAGVVWNEQSTSHEILEYLENYFQQWFIKDWYHYTFNYLFISMEEKKIASPIYHMFG